MQKAAPILEDPDAGIQQLAVERLRGVMHQTVFDASLQQDDHPHAAPDGRIAQGPPEAAAGQEVGVGEQMISSSCGGDGLKVGLLDVAPVADVVADEKGCGLIAPRLAVARRRFRQPVATIEFCPQHQFPKPVQRLLNRRSSGPSTRTA
jgi:hypothetical protein